MARALCRDRGAVPLALVLVVLVGGVAGAGLGFGARALLDDEDGPVAAAVGRAADGGEAVTAHDCPEGAVLGSLRSGDRVFVTARSSEVDGWLRVRDPLDTSVAWWVEAAVVTPDTEVDDLPALACDDPLIEFAAVPTTTIAAADTTTTSVDDTTTTSEATTTTSSTTTTASEATTTTRPTTTTTTTRPTTTTTTTRPTTTTTTRPTTTTTRPTTTTTRPTTTTTTQPPDTAGPTLSVSRSAGTIYEVVQDLTCPGPSSSTVSFSASDPSGIASVVMSWSEFGNTGDQSFGSSSGSRVFGPYGYGSVTPGGQGTISVSVVATDGAGNSTTRSTSITLRSADVCFG